ncbi:MAG: hypothetical protein VB858_15375, partial [Planctomycetaceae bacterium]
MEIQIFRNLDQVTQLLRKFRRWTVLMLVWAVAAVAVLVAWAGVDGSADAGSLSRLIGIAVLLTAVLLSAWQFRPRRGSNRTARLEAARLIENEFPDLKQRLITSIEQLPDPETGRFSWLQRQLSSEVATHAVRNEWRQCVPKGRVFTRMLATVCALVIALYFGSELRPPAGDIIAAETSPEEPGAPVSGTGPEFRVSVVPGTAEVERGTSLLITARFEGPLPAEVTLNQPAGDDPAIQIPMQKSLNDPLFGMRMPSVSRDFDYTVRYDDQSTGTFSITVYELPVVQQIDARIEFPSYAEMTPVLKEDTWRVSAVEGSSVVLFCRLNKDLRQGELVREDGERFPLQKISDTELSALNAAKKLVRNGASTEVTAGIQSSVYSVRVSVDRSAKFEFDLEDEQERVNRIRGEFQIVAHANRPPDLKLVFPARDMQVSPLEEIELEATVWDDFGVRDHGFVLAVGDQAPQSVLLGDSARGREKHELSHLIELERAQAEPDQLVSYYFFAEDIDASGQTRRTMSDMFFAEVRHFEEIFREGQQPSAQQQQQEQEQEQGQNEQKAEELAKLQKQILNATWKLIRRETKSDVSGAFAEDVQLIVESQQQAREKLQELVEELRDTQSKQYAEAVGTAMDDAVKQLAGALDSKSASPLTEALSAERSAYQGLLKLRAREHEVVQQQQQAGSPPSSSSSSSRSQQQLQQLELDREKNRYEEQNQARQQQSEQQQQQQ